MMKILLRFKKKEMDGFKEYVTKLEVVPRLKRPDKFLQATLEDPVYMSWVAKNLFDINKFLDFSSNSVELVFNQIKECHKVLLLAFHRTSLEGKLLEVIPKNLLNNYKTEIEILQNAPITTSKQEQAQTFIICTMRELQKKDLIYEHPWRLPPLHVVKINKNAPTNGLFESFFEDGKTALRGLLRTSYRTGHWKHYYTTGLLLAEGDYDNDEKIGQWSFYYPDGKIKAQGAYDASKKTGQWKEWDRQGKEKIVDYNEISEENDSEESAKSSNL